MNAMKMPDPCIPENIYDAVSKCMTKNRTILALRDKAEEKRIIEAHKIELKLLNTIGTREMYDWLDEGRAMGDVYEVGQYQVILNTHRQNIPGLREFRSSTKSLIKISDTMERFLGRISSETPHQEIKQFLDLIIQQLSIQKSTLYQGIQNYNNLPVFYLGDIIDVTKNMSISCDSQRTPLVARCIDLCAKLRRLPFYAAVDELKNHFEMNNDNLLDQPILDKRRNWRQSIEEHYFIDQQVIIKFHDNGVVKFHDEYGRFINAVSLLYTEDKKSIVLPITNWEKRGHKNLFSLYVPPAKKYQLLNLQMIKDNPQLPIVLTDSVILASYLCKQDINEFITTTWYGELDSVDDVCWLPLKGRDVHYIMFGHGESFEKSNDIAKMTASEVYRHLSSEEIKANISFWNFCMPPNGKNQNKGIFTEPSKLPINESKRIFNKTEDQYEEGRLLTLSDIAVDHAMPPFLLDPVIAQKTVNLMYAEPGIGKTWLALYISCCLACGESAFEGQWKPEKPCKVLYVDGEMGEDDLKSRLAMIKNHFKSEKSQELLEDNFFFVSIRSKVPDLSTDEGQSQVDRHLEEIRRKTGYHERVALMVIDNLGVLTLNSDSHTSWGRFFAWLKELKNKGTSSLVIHHTNKKGDQRGTEVKMAAVDNAFFIEGEGSDDSACLTMTIHVKKGRHTYGGAKKSISVKFNPLAEGSHWRLLDNGMTDKLRQERIKEWTKLGWSNEKMAKALGIESVNTFKALKKKLGMTRKYKRASKSQEKTVTSKRGRPSSAKSPKSDRSPASNTSPESSSN